jgi:hypothetical protein
MRGVDVPPPEEDFTADPVELFFDTPRHPVRRSLIAEQIRVGGSPKRPAAGPAAPTSTST